MTVSQSVTSGAVGRVLPPTLEILSQAEVGFNMELLGAVVCLPEAPSVK